jgi:UDP-N-acetylmuramoylalanine--D-glutamate ligase
VRLALGVDEAAATALLEHADLLVTSPSVSARFPTTDPWLRDALVAAEARGAEIVSEVGLFLRLTRARVLAVTGTKGKTTTASLVAAMLEAGELPVVLGGNIGTPLIERTDELGPGHWAVLELSELQLPTIDRGADVALYTNIGEDHLDRHGTVEAYRAVKARLAELTAPTGRIVLNHDDPGCRELGDGLPPASLAWYGHARPGRGPVEAWVEDGELIVAGERVVPVGDVPLPGRHMRADVLGAALAASLAGVEADALAEAIRGFGGRPASAGAGRGARRRAMGERLAGHHPGGHHGRARGLRRADRPGGRRPGQGPRVRGPGRHDRRAREGRGADRRDGGELEALIVGRVPVRRAASMDEAVRAAAELAQPGDVALLSPAAASFDMFTDYAARGDAFRAAVAALGSEA